MVPARPLLIAAVVFGFLLLKAAVLWGIGRLTALPRPERPVYIIRLAQGGEFGFVVFQTAAQAGVIDALGVTLIERETLDSALMSARSVLEVLGWERHQARTLALRFRRHNVDQLLKMAPHRKDEAKFIAAAKQGRQQLEELFAQERNEAAKRDARSGWSDQDQGSGTPPA